MRPEDFIVDYLEIGHGTDQPVNLQTAKMLGSILDTSKDGLISFQEFQAFEALLCQPDSIYKTAFQLFDRNSSGTITHDEFEKILKKTTLHEKIPFDFKSKKRFVVIRFQTIFSIIYN